MTINIKSAFQSWLPLLGAIVSLRNIIVLSETHHANSSGLVHGAHGHEGGQANGGALEGPAPAGRKKRHVIQVEAERTVPQGQE